MTGTLSRAVPAEWQVGPALEYPAATVPRLVAAVARRRPGAVAVRQWDERLTYGELISIAARLAASLRELGVGPGDRVGVCLRRRPPIVGGLLGVLLSGAVYVPLDPDGPPLRRAAMVADAGLDLIVVDSDTAGLFPGSQVMPLPAPGQVPGPGGGPAGLDDPAYVLFTSGSTGRPKGVVVAHRSLTSFATAFGSVTGVGEGTTAFGYASLGFDVSVLDIFVPLVAGGAIALAGEADRTDPARLQRFAAEHRVDWGCLPVALLPLLDPDGLSGWRTVITGAEAPGPEQVLRWAGPSSRPHRRFLNCYGPTEATVCVTAFETAGHWDRPLPIGRPLPNHRVLVLADDGEPAEVDEPGELLIGGAGVAMGYLGEPALTAERFVPDPLGPGRLYRTGDRGVWLRDGQLMFLGRTDRQVKIRGQRVEIGEVEAALRSHRQVTHAVVDLVGERELVAFCAGTAEETDLREHCGRRLPPAMVPGRFVRLPELPLNPSGKVDLPALRRHLQPGPGPGPAGIDGVALGGFPDPELALAAARVWGSVLNRAVAGAGDDFFTAGGHSIAAMRLVTALRAELGRGISVEDVYAGRTFGALVERLAGTRQAVDQLPAGSPPTPSSAQRRLWFVDRLATDSAAYNIALAERLDGPLDVDALRAALTAVATRHEVLRWRMPDTGGIPRVEVDPPGPVPLTVEDIAERALPRRLAAEAGHRFRLATGPLWRATLLRLAPTSHVLALTFHHAVFDGWSQRPFLADLATAYAGATLAAPAHTFADYVAWRAGRDAARGDADLRWWTEHLSGPPAPLDLPRDRRRPAVQTYRGETAGTALSRTTSDAVRGLAAELGTTAPTVLLAGFGELLRRITGRDDLVIGTPAADRRHEQFADLVGFFIEIVPLRLRMGEGDSFADRVRACTDEFVAALAHPGATLDRMVGALGLPRDPARAPLVQVLFNVYNFPEPRLRLPGLRTERIEPGLAGSPFDLTLYVVDRDGRYAIDCVYNPDLFSASRIETLLAAYGALLDAACADPGRPAARPPLPGIEALVAGVPDPAPPRYADAPVPGRAQPATGTERLIAGVWCRVLGRPSVSARDNFFDLGGDSMAMVRVQAGLAELGREVAVVDLFRYPNIRTLAAHLDGTDSTDTNRRLRLAARRGAARRDRALARQDRRPADEENDS